MAGSFGLRNGHAYLQNTWPLFRLVGRLGGRYELNGERFCVVLHGWVLKA